VKIFVSHNAKDKDTARLLATMFTDRGISVWFDQWEIKPGESITGGIEKGLQECDVFLLMWSAAAKASKWVDTELRAAIRKRVDDTAVRLIPILIDDTPLPLLVADYRGLRLEKADDLEGIVREICPDEAEIDVIVRLQQRFLELVANQYPETDEVRSLFCPVCGSRNLSAFVKHEPMFDERLYAVRCADCGWQQQAKGDCPWEQIRPFKVDLGAATATGFLLLADPVEDSLVRGTLNVLGLENVSFEARIAEPFEVTLLGVTIVIKFDVASRAFTGETDKVEPSGRVSRKSAVLVNLP
jgi:hypothetical protein